MSHPLSYFFITAIVFGVAYFLFLLPGFNDPISVKKFIYKKIALAILISLFLDWSLHSTEGQHFGGLSIIAIFCYTCFTLAQDCPKTYAENAGPILKAIFTFFAFFASFDLEKESRACTIITIFFVIVFCIITYLFARANSFEPKSSQLELIFLCIEYYVALVVSSLLTSNEFIRVIIMVLFEEIILVLVHLVIMYAVKCLYHESTEGYVSIKRREILLK